jgi:hypothetical protein
MKVIPLLLLLVLVVMPSTGCDPQNTPVRNAPPSPTVRQALPDRTPEPKAAPAVLSKTAKAMKEYTDYIESLMAKGKRLLGTKQYHGGFDGINALDDPNSSAAKFSTFYKDMVTECASNRPYKSTDFFADYEEPEALNDWYDDIDTACTDVSLWAQTAHSWQVRGKTDAEVAQAEHKFREDLANARKDIAAMTHR